MSEATLLVSSFVALTSGALYAYLGFRLGRRDVDDAARPAALAFAGWWSGLALSSLVTASTSLLAAVGVLDLDIMVTVTHVQVATITFALAALLYYLIYLFAGRVPLPGLLVMGYLAYFVVLTYWITWAEPTAVDIGAWQIMLINTKTPDASLLIILITLLVGPQILGSLAYASLLFRLQGRTQRFRVALVSGSLLVWFISGFAASLAGVGDSDAWQLVSRSLGVIAPLVILFAYLPPAWARRRFGVEAIRDRRALTP